MRVPDDERTIRHGIVKRPSFKKCEIEIVFESQQNRLFRPRRVRMLDSNFPFVFTGVGIGSEPSSPVPFS
jgi:hypothetical protein